MSRPPAGAPSLGVPAVAHVQTLRNYGLDMLRIFSICGVVAIHVFGLRVGAAPKEGPDWWTAVAIDIGFIWVVPVFVMISGALVLDSRIVVEAPAEFYRKRAARLLPALVFWHVVYLVGVRIWMRDEELSSTRVLQLLFDGTVFTQTYFLWLILGLYAISPLLAGFGGGNGDRRAMTAGVTLLAGTILMYTMPGILAQFGLSRPISLNIFTHWIPYVGYFVAGYALRHFRLKGVQLVAAALMTAALLIFTVWHYGHRGLLPMVDVLFPISYLGLGVALTALGVFTVVLSLAEFIKVPAIAAKTLLVLSNASFGVFLVHLVIFEAIRLNVPAVAGVTSLGAITVAYVVTLVGSFAISVLAALIPGLRRVF